MYIIFQTNSEILILISKYIVHSFLQHWLKLHFPKGCIL